MARQHRTVAALGAAVVVVGAGGYAVGGQTAVLVVAVLAAATVVLAVWLRIPPATLPGTGEAPPERAAHEFTSFAGIHNTLHLAIASRFHFDQVTRPRLWRLLAALLEHRRRADVSHGTAAARTALGADLWPLLDPAREASTGQNEPGVSLETIGRIVGRLEDL